MSIIDARNSMNHVILHAIMALRYRMRRFPFLIQCIVVVETGLVKTGLIFYGSSAKRLHQRG